MARPRTRTKRDDRDRRPKKKVSILDQESIEWIDYKDINLLRRFMSERAKIRARRVTGNDAQQQRAVARAIRVAREMALLPYSVRQVTHRSKGGKGGRDRGDREGPLRGFSEPMPTAPPGARPEAEEGGDDEFTEVPTAESELAEMTESSGEPELVQAPESVEVPEENES
jgi:small subunit ribosomal protein S18